MEVKSLLLAAIAASMSMVASAQVVYPDPADYLTCGNVAVKAGETVLVPITLHQTQESGFTSLQFNIIWPDECQYAGNDALCEPSDECTYEVEDPETHEITYQQAIQWNSNIDIIYPDCMYTGWNASGIPVMKKEVLLCYAYIKAKKDAHKGTYDITAWQLKVRGGDGKTYVSMDNHKIGTITIISSSIVGDVNGDGKVDVSDVNLTINVMLGKATKDQYPATDVNGDGKVDVTDVNQVINSMLGR